MNIKFFCPRWGSEDTSWETFATKVKDAGFDGVESPIPFEDEQKLAMTGALNKNGLLLIGQYYQSFEKDIILHKDNFRKHLCNMIKLRPLLIDSQTGKDYFSAQENKELFQIADRFTQETGIQVAHETHRNKALYAAHIAKDLLVENPEIHITADFSHWCNVSESLLEQQEEAVKIAISKTIHIHARVGHAESSQISDPRAPEWQVEIDAHLNWWDNIVQCRINSGADLLTITTEFGPPPYMPTLPFSRTPVASQWEINVYMLNLLKNRYQIFV